MFNSQSYENSRPDGVGLMEVVDGKAEEQRLFVPLKRTELGGEVIGPLADLRLVQTFAYSRQQCERVLEALYRFPLPGDAAVTGVRVRFGEVEIATQLKEREQAETEYKEAVQQGRQAALLTRESPDVFTLQVAGIQPDQPVVVETRYVQLARPQGDAAQWLLRVPLTAAPRYVRQDEAGSRYAQGQPLALLRDPGHRFALDLVIREAGQVSSPTHRLDVLPEGGAHDRRVRLYDEEVIPDRDFVLLWTPHQERDRPALSVLLHEDRDAGQVYYLALVAPPGAHEPGSGAAREVILLVDHSGSMSGAKWEASDWAVNSFLSSLSERDQFALGLFHSTTSWFARQTRAATAENLQQAARYLDENRDSGGTNLGVALEQALSIGRADRQERARHLLIVTDAQVSDEARILSLADREAKRSARRRISVLCIDAAPNAFLAHELAERGGGVAHFLTSSPDQEDITTALEDVLADWAEPVLVGLQLEVNRAEGEAAGKEVLSSGRQLMGWGAGKTTVDLGDLPRGRALWVAGRVPRGKGPLQFDLRTARETVASCRIDEEEGEDERPALKALFGARRLLGLEYLMHAGLEGDALKEQLARLGYDLDQVLAGQEPAVYAENARRAAREALKPLLVRESLTYGLACAETGFVAVRQEAGKLVEGRVAVANALPAGWSEEFLSAGAPALLRRMSGLGAQITGLAAPRAAPPPADAPTGRGLLRRRQAAPMDLQAAFRSVDGEAAVESERPPAVVFSGAPSFVGGEAVLYDSARDAGPLPDQATISRIEVRFADPGLAAEAIDPGLVLLIYVGDLALPRARIRVGDLVRLGGARPLNLRRGTGQVVRIVLADPNGAWSSSAPQMTVQVAI